MLTNRYTSHSVNEPLRASALAWPFYSIHGLERLCQGWAQHHISSASWRAGQGASHAWKNKQTKKQAMRHNFGQTVWLQLSPTVLPEQHSVHIWCYVTKQHFCQGLYPRNAPGCTCRLNNKPIRVHQLDGTSTPHGSSNLMCFCRAYLHQTIWHNYGEKTEIMQRYCLAPSWLKTIGNKTCDCLKQKRVICGSHNETVVSFLKLVTST